MPSEAVSWNSSLAFLWGGRFSGPVFSGPIRFDAFPGGRTPFREGKRYAEGSETVSRVAGTPFRIPTLTWNEWGT
jgi:hypothetical protein